MRLSDFNRLVDRYCRGKGIRFADELVGTHEEKFQSYKYYFVCCNTGKVDNAFYSKQEVVDFVRGK